MERHCKDVHSDVAQLVEWMAAERDADGQVNVPWAEIVVEVKLRDRQAA